MNSTIDEIDGSSLQTNTYQAVTFWGPLYVIKSQGGLNHDVQCSKQSTICFLAQTCV